MSNDFRGARRTVTVVLCSQPELGLNVRRKRNVFRLRLNRARELQHKVSVFREFQTAGAEHQKAR